MEQKILLMCFLTRVTIFNFCIYYLLTKLTFICDINRNMVHTYVCASTKTYSLCPALCVAVAAGTSIHVHSLCHVPRPFLYPHSFNLCRILSEAKMTLIKGERE